MKIVTPLGGYGNVNGLTNNVEINPLNASRTCKIANDITAHAQCQQW